MNSERGGQSQAGDGLRSAQPTRRTVLKGAAALAAGAGVQAFPARSAAAAGAAGTGPAAPHGTTLDATVVRPSSVTTGYRHLTSGPGEPHLVRSDLGTRAVAGRGGRRRALLSFAHLTDIHVVDAQSPARVEYLDRYNDGPGAPLLFGSAYRPHEFLTPQVADAIVHAVEESGRGPAVGQRLGFAVCTGDNVDNCQRNELRWQLGVLDGTSLHPDSGDPGKYEGVADQYTGLAGEGYDRHYWHPEPKPDGAAAEDDLKSLHGFPTMRGLLAAATRAFTPRGLSIPWYTCYGNHDGLVQGNFPRSFQLTNVATGSVKQTGTPAPSAADFQRALAEQDANALFTPSGTVPRMVTADAERKVLSRSETVKEHFRTGGRPLGHGYTSRNVTDGTAHYVFDPHPQVRAIVMDTVNQNGEANGSLDAAQFAWLQARLQEVSGKGRDRLVVVFSHHTSATMDNRIVSVDDPQPRVLGPEVVALFLRFPNVVLWVNGHTHVNQVVPHRRSGGGAFWEVSTAAHVDFPCQARLVELVDNRDGTLSVFGTILDAAAPLQHSDLGSSLQLASLARELAANDPQETTSNRRGTLGDRNVELLVRTPFALQHRSSGATGGSQQTGTGAGARAGAGAGAGVGAGAGDGGRRLAATGASGSAAALAAAAVAAGVVGLRRAGRD